jgi:hypothetical protein
VKTKDACNRGLPNQTIMDKYTDDGQKRSHRSKYERQCVEFCEI